MGYFRNLFSALLGKPSPDVENLRRQLRGMEREVSDLNSNLENLQQQLTVKSGEAQSQEQQIGYLRQQLASEVSGGQGLAKRSAELEQQLADKSREAQSLRQQTDDLQQQLRDKTKEAEELRKQTHEMQRELTDKTGEAEEAVQKFQAAQKYIEQKSSEYNTAIAPYNTVLKMLKNTESMSEVLADAGIEASSEPNIGQQIQFANFFSDELLFARKIYDALYEYKKDHPEPLTANEIALLDHLNNYYRDTFDLKFDVLDHSVQRKLESGDKVLFSASEMIVNGKPGKVDVYRVSAQCVPMLRDNYGDRREKAVILE